MARLAIILYEGSPGSTSIRLGRILDFFGVPWKAVEASELGNIADGLEYAVFGSIRAVAATLKERQEANPPVLRPAAFYAYADDERSSFGGHAASLPGCKFFTPRGAHRQCLTQNIR